MLTQLLGDAPARCTCQRVLGLPTLQDGGVPAPALPPSRAAGATLLQAPPRRLEGSHPTLSLAPAPEPAPGSGQTRSGLRSHAPSARPCLPAPRRPAPDPPRLRAWSQQQEQPAALLHAPRWTLVPAVPIAGISHRHSRDGHRCPGRKSQAGRGMQTGAGTVPTCPGLGPHGLLTSLSRQPRSYLLLIRAVAVLVSPSIISFRDH